MALRDRYLPAVLVVMLFAFSSNAQKGKPLPGIDSVRLINNILYEYRGGVGLYAGSVIPSSPGGGIALDINNNIIIGTNPTITRSTNNFIFSNDAFITNSNDNASFANHIKLNSVNGTFSGGADHTFYPGANYAAVLGDGSNAGGYSSFTGGLTNSNFIYGGGALGYNLKLGTLATNNVYERTVAIGSNMNIQASDVYMLGTGTSTIWNQPGAYFSFGTYKFGLLPDGRVLINGIAYRFPATQQAGVLTNDGNGNLSWVNQTQSAKSVEGKYKMYDLRTGQFVGVIKTQ